MPTVKTVSETSVDKAQAAETQLVYQGKVRDVYQAGANHLLLVATDRISAFDCVLPTPIPRKGEVLTALSAFWFERLKHLAKNHFISVDFNKFPEAFRRREKEFRGRSLLVEKTKVFPVECVVRGYLDGSGWKDYRKTGKVCGHVLPADLRQGERLPEPIFTPATKAATGHDVNIDERRFAEICGAQAAEQLKSVSLQIYKEASGYALSRSIIVADTKFEFGLDEDGDILLIDEVLTPDSSRFWSAENYAPGAPQPSFDKQFVRDYLETLDWNKQPPAPALPPQIIEATTTRYLAAYEILTGKKL
ncbi:MAG: phosphoribosylaminoimidazolesuccinocarboxamide synthase [Acidobacteria bacterium]|jgi:phosphoribosylaminoimidazole-succinocarboxamide synthase|nr:phosphoribosylaminoimidazolesuccinocarboxamide synthase [Acidobacteriota bacterium]